MVSPSLVVLVAKVRNTKKKKVKTLTQMYKSPNKEENNDDDYDDLKKEQKKDSIYTIKNMVM